MRRILVLIIAACVLHTGGTRAQVPSDEPVYTANDVLAAELWQLAKATNSRIGFEATDHVRIGAPKNVPALSVSTVEEGLNAVVGVDERYEWRKLAGVFVVRPTRAWDDPVNPFNRKVRAVQIANAQPQGVLYGLRDFIYTGKFAIEPSPSASEPVSFNLPSGTVVDVLNELVIASDQTMWIVSYRPLGQPAERFRGWDLTLQLKDAKFVTGYSGSPPPRRR